MVENSIPKTILIIEDDLMIRNLYSLQLRRGPYQVLEADNGLTGLHIFRENHNKIDLVLLDMHMPGIEGISVFRELHAIDPQACITCVSGSIEPSNLEEIQNNPSFCGASEKPATSKELFDLIESSMSRKIEIDRSLLTKNSSYQG